MEAGTVSIDSIEVICHRAYQILFPHEIQGKKTTCVAAFTVGFEQKPPSFLSSYVSSRKSVDMQEMICVEAALATSGPVEVPPGDNWVGSQVLTISSL